MTSDPPSNRNDCKRPPLLDQEVLKVFMSRNPSPDEAMRFMFSVLAARSRMESLLIEEEPGENEDKEP